MSDLKILISGLLDTERTTKDINKQISRLTHRLDKLRINVQIDDNILKTMKSFSEQMKRIQGEAIQAGKRIEEVIMPDGTKVKTTRFDDLARSLDDLTISAGKNAKTASDIAQQTVGTNKNINQEMTKNLKLNRESISEKKNGLSLLRQEYSDIKGIHKVTVERDKVGKTISARYVSDHQKAKQIGDQKKRETLEAQKQLQLYKQQAQLNAQNIRRTHGTTVDNTALSQYINQVNTLKTTTPNLNHRMNELSMQFKKVSGNAREAAGALQQSGMSMAEMMRTAMIKFPIKYPSGVKTPLIAGNLRKVEQLQRNLKK